jgi:hypothetical protein
MMTRSFIKPEELPPRELHHEGWCRVPRVLGAVAAFPVLRSPGTFFPSAATTSNDNRQQLRVIWLLFSSRRPCLMCCLCADLGDPLAVALSPPQSVPVVF